MTTKNYIRLIANSLRLLRSTYSLRTVYLKKGLRTIDFARLTTKQGNIRKNSADYARLTRKIRKIHAYLNQSSQKQLTWAGYAFENICLKHVIKIKAALGLAGVSTIETQRSFHGDKKSEGAQIDLVFARADNCINLCEIKFSKDIYVLTKQNQEALERKARVFQREFGTQKSNIYNNDYSLWRRRNHLLHRNSPKPINDEWFVLNSPATSRQKKRPQGNP